MNTIRWKKRKARKIQICTALASVKGCGATIWPGQFYFSALFRVGVTAPVLCVECGQNDMVTEEYQGPWNVITRTEGVTVAAGFYSVKKARAYIRSTKRRDIMIAVAPRRAWK